MWAFICRCRGHKWFPDNGPSEYLPLWDVCMRCREERVMLPYGECLGGHPMAEHYNSDGRRVAIEHCLAPH